MYLKQIEEKTKNFPFCATPSSEHAHFYIRRPLMQMFGLELKKSCKSEDGRWQPNGYTAKHMIPTNKSAPVWQLKEGVDAVIDSKVISAKEIKAKQQKIDLMYVKGRISEKEVHDIQLIKAGKRVEIPSKYKSFEDYRRKLQQKSSYIVIRAEVTQHLDHEGKLLNKPIESVVHYTTFPKLTGKSLDCKSFTESGNGNLRKLTSDKESKLKGKFKSIIKLNALMAAKHQEGLSLVIPNAYFDGLSDEGMKKARKIFVEAAIESAKEIIEEGKYPGFREIFVNTHHSKIKDTKDLNELINRANDKGVKIAINYGDLSAPSRASNGIKFAEPIMGDGVGYVGNGALSASGNIAVEENLTRKTLGETVLMFSGAFNEKVLDERYYRGESVQSDVQNEESQYRTQNIMVSKSQNREQKPSQHKMQNIQCIRNRSTVCFAIAASLSALIIVSASVTQTYVFLAALVIPAAIGLCGWSLYKKEQENRPSSNIQNNVKTEGAFHSTSKVWSAFQF